MQTSSISSFKKFLIRFLLPSVAITGLTAVGLDRYFDSRIILNTQSSGAYKIHRNITQKNKTEIPIFGSSRASGSYIPDLIDSACFNYGIEKTQFNLLELFLRNELKQNKSVPVIINLDYELWADWIGDYSNYIPNLGNNDIQRYFSQYDKWYYHVPGLRYYGFYQHYFKNYTSNKSNKNYLNKGGFFLLEKTSEADLQSEIEMRKKVPFVYVPSPEKEKKFFDLLTSNRNREILIVIAPYHSSYMQSLKGRELAEDFFARLAACPHVHVFNYSNASYPDELFKNTTHLNYEGARRFSSELKREFHNIAPGYFN
jgi:hypothetical protein